MTTTLTSQAKPSSTLAFTSLPSLASHWAIQPRALHIHRLSGFDVSDFLVAVLSCIPSSLARAAVPSYISSSFARIAVRPGLGSEMDESANKPGRTAPGLSRVKAHVVCTFSLRERRASFAFICGASSGF